MTTKALAVVGLLAALSAAAGAEEAEGVVKPAPPPAKLAEFKARDAIGTYQRQLQAGYIAAGVPAPYVERLTPLDMEIYNARVAGDADRARLLRQQEEAILTPVYVPKVLEYYSAHPYQVDTGTISFPVWSNEAATVVNAGDSLEPGTQIVDLPLYQKKLREAYTNIGIPDDVIVQLLAIDSEIYNAYATGNADSTSALRQRERQLVSDDQALKIAAYFDAHPFAIRTPKANFTAWQRAKNEAAKATPGAAPKRVEKQIPNGAVVPSGSVGEVEQKKERSKP